MTRRCGCGTATPASASACCRDTRASIRSVCFSPDGSILASGSYDQTVRLWDSHTGECLRLLQGHTNPVSSVCFSPDGSILASAGYDKTVRLWDSHTGACLHAAAGTYSLDLVRLLQP